MLKSLEKLCASHFGDKVTFKVFHPIQYYDALRTIKNWEEEQATRKEKGIGENLIPSFVVDSYLIKSLYQ